MKLFNIKVLLTCALALILGTQNVNAESASLDFSVEIPPYMQIQTLTSAVLTANVTDRTGNLYAPLSSKFRVISNSNETKTLYLKAETLTENGLEEAMFEMGGRVYVAFASLKHKPKGQALANCINGAHPKESPGVVAYPITSLYGAKHKFNRSIRKYEVYVDNGTTDITVNVGSNVLRNSFASNDPKGFYQATLSLTEADI